MPKKEHQKSVSGKKHNFCYSFDILVTLSRPCIYYKETSPMSPGYYCHSTIFWPNTYKVQIQWTSTMALSFCHLVIFNKIISQILCLSCSLTLLLIILLVRVPQRRKTFLLQVGNNALSCIRSSFLSLLQDLFHLSDIFHKNHSKCNSSKGLLCPHFGFLNRQSSDVGICHNQCLSLIHQKLYFLANL